MGVNHNASYLMKFRQKYNESNNYAFIYRKGVSQMKYVGFCNNCL